MFTIKKELTKSIQNNINFDSLFISHNLIQNGCDDVLCGPAINSFLSLNKLYVSGIAPNLYKYRMAG